MGGEYGVPIGCKEPRTPTKQSSKHLALEADSNISPPLRCPGAPPARPPSEASAKSALLAQATAAGRRPAKRQSPLLLLAGGGGPGRGHVCAAVLVDLGQRGLRPHASVLWLRPVLRASAGNEQAPAARVLRPAVAERGGHNFADIREPVVAPPWCRAAGAHVAGGGRGEWGGRIPRFRSCRRAAAASKRRGRRP